MKSSTRDGVESKLHQAKGRIKEVAGKITDSPELEIEGKDENTAGNIKKVFGR